MGFEKNVAVSYHVDGAEHSLTFRPQSHLKPALSVSCCSALTVDFTQILAYKNTWATKKVCSWKKQEKRFSASTVKNTTFPTKWVVKAKI